MVQIPPLSTLASPYCVSLSHPFIKKSNFPFFKSFPNGLYVGVRVLQIPLKLPHTQISPQGFLYRNPRHLRWISITCEDGYSQEVKYTILNMKKTSMFQYAFRHLIFCQHFLPCSSLMSHHELKTGWALWREESYELIITIKTTIPAAFYLYQKSVCFLQNRISGC